MSAAGRSTRMAPHQPSYADSRRLQESAIGKESGYGDEELSIVASDEDASSQDSSNGILRASKENKKSGAQAPVDLVRKETKYVNILRYAIVIILVGSGILFGVGAYLTAKDAYGDDGDKESICRLEENFHFSDFVQAVTSSLNKAWEIRLTAAFTISAAITSHSLTDASNSWPTVFLPHLEAQTTGILTTLDGTDRIVFAPLVSSFQTDEFENFAIGRQQNECQVADCNLRNVDGSDATGSSNGNNINNILGPVLQTSPGFLGGTEESFLLVDLFSDPVQGPALTRMVNSKAAVFSELAGESSNDQTLTESSSASITTDKNETLAMGPTTTLFYPIFEDYSRGRVVGSLSMDITWRELLENTLPFAIDGATMILENSCQSEMMATFTVNEDGTLEYTGPLESTPDFGEEDVIVLPGGYDYGEFDEGLSSSSCDYRVHMLESPPGTAAFAGDDDDDKSSRPAAYTVIVALVYLMLLVTFLVYDWLVERRQSVVINIATKSSAIVENLFPAQVRDRMLQNIGDNKKQKAEDENGVPNPDAADPTAAPPGTGTTKSGKPAAADTAVSVKQFLTNMPENANDLSSQPIADLFSNTTVLFADIAGFTAWSSQREPPQVFTLLETLYRSFDVIAGKLKVFKVETIGDCYMAVTGLPSPDEQHAVHMSRFAYQCLIGMKELIKELEAVLGPGTSDLALRVGLHSGPVTAGVLRGEKSRFQLFGDTVNTASRMESTGERGKIQVSQETGDLLMAAGKSHWLKPRDETIVAKGKGEMKTYWLDPTKKRRNTKSQKEIRVTQEIALTNGQYVDKPMSPAEVSFDEKYARLIDWNVDVLLHHLARVISCRSRTPARGSLVNHSSEVALLPLPVNDVAEVVALPPFDSDSSRFRRARPDVSMLQQTREDLHEYVKRIALMYRDVPFHNFEHASHVTLCANKLLNRLINSDEYETEEELHNATFGISSDPLTHFAIVFAALIHDVDHTGLPNAQLIKDESEVAVKFDNKSVAEQNSTHLGWEMLMDPRFERLRKCIYQTNVERKRFRQLVINSVMATDIADRQVNQERQNKWDKAFRRSVAEDATPLQIQDDMNRKGTAVIEHIIQVSDVAHTMQHWHIYRRWNERLFHEMHNSFQSGRVAVDPSTNWYIGELGFFDYYLIPLAMKLKECGVFGASGYEYISYVLKNKKEWERKGRQVVQEMVLLYKDSEETDDDDDETTDSEMDSDDLEYDSPGDLSDSEFDDADIDSMHPAQEE